MLTISQNKLQYNNILNLNKVSFKAVDDIFAKSRNGHLLKDTFDRAGNSLDIYSNGLYPANVLSNLSKKHFVFDGIECASIEGFLQSLKVKDSAEQAEICALFGGTAKKAAHKNSDWISTQKLYWQGREYDRSSDDYLNLVFRAFLECYNQNDVFKTALDSTKGIKLTHLNGKTEKSKTILTSDEFTQILTKIRDKDF